MQKIAFYNSKGGTGKTTLSGSVANEIKNCRVVLIDMDVQANLSNWLLTDNQEWELADVLSGKSTIENALVEIRPGLSIIPTLGAVGDLQHFVDSDLARSVQSIGFLMQDLENFADIVICDMSPSSGLLERYVLAAMDSLVVPVSAEYFGLEGVRIVETFLQSINEQNRTNVEISTIALNMMNRSFSRHIAVEEALSQLRYPIHVIPQDAQLANAQFMHSCIDSACRSHASISALAQKLEASYAR